MTTREPFRISHVVNAPIKKVWQAWTIQSQLEKWWGPVGLEMHVAKADVRTGGKFHYQMASHPAASEKFEVWGAFDYLEVEEEQRIVFVNYFSNEAGEKARHYMNPEWPLEVKSTLTFVEDGDKTLLHLEGGPINAAPNEEAVYYENLESMRIGFSGTFSQLDDFLAGQ
jgi:uncharacterized protein YndB with AHSA1/START domain